MSDCINHDLLLRYSLETTSKEEDKSIEGHVKHCFECTARLKEISDGLNSESDEVIDDKEQFRLSLVALYGSYYGRDAAEALGISTKSIGRYESGARKIPGKVFVRLDAVLEEKGEELRLVRREGLARIEKREQKKKAQPKKGTKS